VLDLSALRPGGNRPDVGQQMVRIPDRQCIEQLQHPSNNASSGGDLPRSGERRPRGGYLFRISTQG
jgi:hypothetical protein